MKKNTTVYLDADLLLQFDVIAEQVGTNRSKFVTVSMRKFVEKHEKIKKMKERDENAD